MPARSENGCVIILFTHNLAGVVINAPFLTHPGLIHSLFTLIVQENPEFDLHFEKVYRWVASSTAEKNSFISCIWKLNQRYLRKKVEFVNVSSQLLEGEETLYSYCSHPCERTPLFMVWLYLFKGLCRGQIRCFSWPDFRCNLLCVHWVSLCYCLWVQAYR